MPSLFVLSGPSGAGKDAVLQGMKDAGLAFYHAITMTTRPQRAGERDGVDYHFTSEEYFKDMIERDDLLEWAEVYGHRYGVPRQSVEQALGRGEDVIVKVDVQGAKTIKERMPGAMLLFLTTSSREEQEERLKGRSTESAAELELRLATFHDEMKSLPFFDYIVVNRQGELDSAVSRITAIITAERCRVSPHTTSL
ncbi:guanylate kinase [Chloroflexota bacterium]